MKNNYSLVGLNAVVVFVTCLSLWSQFSLANNTADLTALIHLLDESGISTTTDSSALLAEQAVVVISHGQLDDVQVATYNNQFSGQLLALPLTIKLSDDSSINNDEKETESERDRRFAAALKQDSIIYLYINASHFNGSVNTMSDKFGPLLENNFQTKLKAMRFAALPSEYIQQWAVSLGSVEPEYSGGYK
jgi:hypothetical protein